VIAEVARVLRPGGLFFYDTINRTWMSKLAVITIMQEWRWTAFAEPNSHVWEKFITPAELAATLARHGLESRETRGISVTHRNPIAMVLDFHRRVRGDISFQELGRRLGFRESDELAVSYMGYAAKGAVTAART
jgi:2-polyprenyl-6-hydroxyphenyl methylase / 3-demethylubiquinone-9 3-methyltransferase